MNKVILIRPVSDIYRNYSIPWGILYIGSVLAAHGYSVRIIDQIVEEDWRKTLTENLKENPICVGISSMTGKQIVYGLEISKFIKEYNPEIPIIWGGVHPTIMPQQTLAHQFIDIVVRGEGEITFLEIVKALEKNKTIEGIDGAWYKYKGKICANKGREMLNLNKLPDVSYSLIHTEKYITKHERKQAKRHFELCTSRGCTYKCSFCYTTIYNNCYRPLKTEKVIRNLLYLKDKFKIDGITWREDNFFHDKKRVEDLSTEIINNKLNITWSANCRIDHFVSYNSSFMDLIKKSGCRTLGLGGESGSDIILNLLRKRITRAQIINSAKRLKEYGIKGYYQFMLGLPTETKDDVFQTIDVIGEILKILPDAQFQGPTFYTPYPGTPLYALCVKMGFKSPERLEEWANFEWDDLKLPLLSKEYKKFLTRVKYTIDPLNKFYLLLNTYFKLKADLLFKYKIVLPCPEKTIYDLLVRYKLI